MFRPLELVGMNRTCLGLCCPYGLDVRAQYQAGRALACLVVGQTAVEAVPSLPLPYVPIRSYPHLTEKAYYFLVNHLSCLRMHNVLYNPLAPVFPSS